jgi:hypothetical protein
MPRLSKVIKLLVSVDPLDRAAWQVALRRAIHMLGKMRSVKAQYLLECIKGAEEDEVHVIRQLQFDLAHPTGNSWPPPRPP